MKPLSSPLRLGDGRRLRHEGKGLAPGQEAWRGPGGLLVLIEAQATYGAHVSVSVHGRAPDSETVRLIREALFDADAKVAEGKVSLAGVRHLIEMKATVH